MLPENFTLGANKYSICKTLLTVQHLEGGILTLAWSYQQKPGCIASQNDCSGLKEVTEQQGGCINYLTK